MKEIKLNLSIEETNLILEALGNLPFVRVLSLIGKIQEQAGQQLNGQAQELHPAAQKSAPPKIKADK